jgi:uncharacterized protein (TIGR02147 family)
LFIFNEFRWNLVNIFKYLDYREFINDLVKERKIVDRTMSFQRLASLLRVQKSYLSQVLRGTANLNQDQLFLLISYFQFGEKEAHYLRLLLEYERTGLKERKDELKRSLHASQEAHRRSEQHIEYQSLDAEQSHVREYYLDSLNQLLHVCLSIERYRVDPTLLARDLGVPAQRIFQVLDKLESLHIIRRSEGGIEVLVKGLHLAKEAKEFLNWNQQMRLMAMQRNQYFQSGKSYAFSVLFSADEETRCRIHEQFLEFLQKTQQKVKKAASNHVYQLNFELFPWTDE